MISGGESGQLVATWTGTFQACLLPDHAILGFRRQPESGLSAVDAIMHDMTNDYRSAPPVADADGRQYRPLCVIWFPHHEC